MIEAVHLYPDDHEHLRRPRQRRRPDAPRGAGAASTLHWHAVELGDTPPRRCDLVFMGGGQDRVQHTVADDLRRLRGWLETTLGDGGVVFAVCAGLQLLGRRYVAADGSVLEGVGLLDLETVAARPGEWRLIGNVVVDVETADGAQVLAGFENHGGRTWLGAGARPLGTVRLRAAATTAATAARECARARSWPPTCTVRSCPRTPG